MDTQDNFFMLGRFSSDGTLDDLGACPGQERFLEKILQSAEEFTNEHHGGRTINIDMLNILKSRIDEHKFYEALMGAYSLGYENGFLKARENSK